MGTDKRVCDNDFRRIAKQEIVKWWNSNDDAIGEYGSINIADICTVWQCIIDGNFKSIHRLNFDCGGYFFEFIYHSSNDSYELYVFKRIL